MVDQSIVQKAFRFHSAEKSSFYDHLVINVDIAAARCYTFGDHLVIKKEM